MSSVTVQGPTPIIQHFPISHSAYSTHSECSQKYDFSYRKKLKKVDTQSTLLLGKVFDHIFNTYVLEKLKGNYVDITFLFEKTWFDLYENVPHVATKDENAVYHGMSHLCHQVPKVFDDAKLEVMTDLHGEPCIQRRNTFDIGRGVKALTIIDMIAYSKTLNAVMPIDVKCSGMHTDRQKVEEFIPVAEQLLLYALSVENDPGLQVDSVDYAGFWIGHRKMMPTKLKSGDYAKNAAFPTFHAPFISRLNPLHKKQIPQRYINKQILINTGISTANTLSTHNSPCGMCDYKELCWHGTTNGLVKKVRRSK